MKIVLHGFGNFPVFFYHLIRCSIELSDGIRWSIVLTSKHHEQRFIDILGAHNVLTIDHSTAAFKKYQTNRKEVIYPGQIYQDIAAEKRGYTNTSGKKQYQRTMHIYDQVDCFIKSKSPDVALVSQVEGVDGKIFIRSARKNGAEVVVPTGMRNIGGIYFSPDELETFPSYASNIIERDRFLANEYLESMQHEKKPAWYNINKQLDEPILDNFRLPLITRVRKSFVYMAKNQLFFEKDKLRASLLNNMPHLRDLFWRIRELKNSRLHNISDIEELPIKYIFYPLQYTPESSINTPAAYFVDQLRAIDAIRFAMPSDYKLVVKEHPQCIKVRDGNLIKALLKCAGVEVAYYKLNTEELIEKASITVSVTGTATLEAFLKSKQSIALGHCLSSNLIGGVSVFETLAADINRKLQTEVRKSEILDGLSKMMNIRVEAIFAAPGLPGEPVLRSSNVHNFYDGLILHCRKVGVYE